MADTHTNLQRQKENLTLQDLQSKIDKYLPTMRGQLSDGNHTFGDLYFHRMVLFAAICRQNKDLAWKSKQHSDGTMYPNYFIVGIETPEGPYTYHYHKKFWESFSNIKTLDRAPKWDGHQPEDVTRLLSLLD